MRKYFIVMFVSLMLFMVSPANVKGGDKILIFSWGQVISLDFFGWHLYGSDCSMVNCKTDSSIKVPVNYYEGMVDYTTDYQLTSPDGQEKEWFFALTSLDDSGNESGCSNETSIVIDFEAPLVPTTLTVIIKAE